MAFGQKSDDNKYRQQSAKECNCMQFFAGFISA